MAVALWTDAGGRIAVVNGRITFDDGAAGPIPDDGPITSGVFRPSNYPPEDNLSGIAPPYAGSLSEFIGSNPNGIWRLYVIDDTSADSGSLAQGWSLNVITAPTIAVTSPAGQLIHNEDEEGIVNLLIADADTPTTPADDLLPSVVSANGALVPRENVSFTRTGGDVASGLTYVARIQPGTNQPQDSVRTTNTLTFTVTRKADSAKASANVTNVVVPINDPPLISRITERVTEEDRAITVNFVVSDVDTLPRDLEILATSGNTTVVANTNLQFYGQATNRLTSLPSNEVNLTIIPNTDQIGNADITITVTDKSTLPPSQVSSTTFRVRVTDRNDPPTISTIADISLASGATSTNIAFTVTDPENASVRVTASSSDERFVRNANIVINPVESTASARTIRVTAESAVTGSAVITVTATDGQTSTSTTFRVNVVESRERSFSNNRRISINDNGPATDYPSTVTVSDLAGEVAQVRVLLSGFAHPFPDDVDILLVSPSGKKALVMSDAGGGVFSTNLNLTFADGAESSAPDNGPLATGSYKPSNFDAGADGFASPAPGSPYATSFSTFVGDSPNGTWSLYVMDDTPSDSGSINGGWTLYVTTKPRVVGLTDLAIIEDQEFRQNFLLVEESFVPIDVTWRTTSTNTAVVRTNDLVVTGSGTNWTIRGTPVADASGVTEIEVIGRNQFAQEFSGKFKVTVTAENDRPFITDVADQLIFAGTRTPSIEFNYGDAETAKKDIRLDITSSNARLIPTNNVFVLGNTLVVAPVGNFSGISDITLTVTDGSGLTASTTFTVTVLPSLNPQFANPAKITIRDNNSADLYPSTLEVSGVSGTVARVTVTLAEVSHPYPADVDVLLVGPRGQKVVVMSDAAGSGRLDNVRLTLDDRAAEVIPFNPSTPILSGTYKPTNHQGADTFPSPAPGGPYGAVLGDFAGTDPNGTWSLYVVDDGSPDAGSIAGGWILNIFTTNPTISVIPDQTTDESVTLTVPFRVEDADTPAANLVTSAVSDVPSLVGLAINGTGNDRTLVITPTAFQSGECNITVSVSDGSPNVASSTFKLTIRPVNQAPEIGGLADKLTPANVELRMPFTVFDRDSDVASVTVSASLSKPSLGTLDVSGAAADRLLTFRPSGEQGQGFVTVIASDGQANSTNVFSLTVTAPYLLVISPVNDQSMDENGVLNVPVTVSSIGGPIVGTVTVTGSSSNTGLVSRVDISGSGTNFVATIRPLLNRSGQTEITLTAQDSLGSGTETFVVSVLPLNAPSIAPIPPQTTFQNTPVFVTLGVEDADTPITALEIGRAHV